MSKKYLIPESSLIGTRKRTSTFVSDEMIEVEVLDAKQIDEQYDDFFLHNEFVTFADSLAANNLQIIKTVK